MKQVYKANKEDINRNQYEMQRINIFLTKEQKAELYKLKYKYQLSFTYLLKILQNYYSVLEPINVYCKGNKLYDLKNGHKTSIKIFKNIKEEFNKASYNNNLIIMYLERLDKKILNQKTFEKARNMIANQMEITIDPFYNYNENYRQYLYMQKRFEKQ